MARRAARVEGKVEAEHRGARGEEERANPRRRRRAHAAQVRADREPEPEYPVDMQPESNVANWHPSGRLPPPPARSPWHPSQSRPQVTCSVALERRRGGRGALLLGGYFRGLEGEGGRCFKGQEQGRAEEERKQGARRLWGRQVPGVSHSLSAWREHGLQLKLSFSRVYRVHCRTIPYHTELYPTLVFRINSIEGIV